jgi:hypothetical protein
MNSEMFHQWLSSKLLPSWEKVYGNKKMVLILDNAAYHHYREIGLLNQMSKAELKLLTDKYKVEYIEIPLNEHRLKLLMETPEISAHVTDDDVNCRIYINNEIDVFGKATKRNPMVPTSDELRLGIIKWLESNNKQVLECKIERTLKEKGHKVLWLPPYSPELQPIELFWAGGKNFVANNMRFGMSMKEVVYLLRCGWYGYNNNDDSINEDNNQTTLKERKAIDCEKLFNHVVNIINKKYIPLCEGLTGTLGDLQVDEDHQKITAGMPVDMMLNHCLDDDEYDDIIDDIIVDDEFRFFRRKTDVARAYNVRFK